MAEITREEILTISRYSTWEADFIDDAFYDAEIYPPKSAWTKFIRTLVFGLGVLFFAAGVIFFFAFNWDELHKFVKLSIVEALIIIPIAIIFLNNPDKFLRQILLTLASLLTGTIFAVFGQVYQTGANAYDLFLIWTICITIWVVIADFQPLYLIYILLINTTIVTASQQTNWIPQTYSVFNLTFGFTFVSLVVLMYLSVNKIIESLKLWFEKTLIFLSLMILTTAVIVGIFAEYESSYILTIILLLITFGGGVYYATQKKRIFYIAVIGTFTVFILSALIGKSIDDAVIMLTANSLFVGLAFTGLVKLSVHLKSIGYE